MTVGKKMGLFRRIGRAIRRMPWIVWALIAPAVIIGTCQLLRPGQRIEVVGSGPLHHLRTQDAPDGVHYILDVARTESLRDTRRRIQKTIARYPDIVVFGLDARVLQGGKEAERRARRALEELTRQAENVPSVPVVASFAVPEDASASLREAVARLNEWWRLELCRGEGLRLCVDLQRHAGEVSAIREAVARAVSDALNRYQTLRASTQPQD